MRSNNRQIFCCQYYPDSKGHIDLIKYFYSEKNGQINIDTISYAVLNGHLDCLTFFLENTNIYNIENIDYHELLIFAAKHGHLDCIKYLYSKGSPLSTWTIAYAAEYGHLDCVKYLIANGCPVDNVAIFNAAANGHLDCVKYLIANGCSISNTNKSSIYYIVRNGHKDVLKYYINENFIKNLDDLFIALDKYPSIIDLDDKFWRDLLFNKDLSKYNTLNSFVTESKTEISNKIQLCEEHLSYKLVPNDIVKHILSSYF